MEYSQLNELYEQLYQARNACDPSTWMYKSFDDALKATRELISRFNVAELV